MKTAKGAFVITRGLVEVPDDIGESLGWRRMEEEDAAADAAPQSARMSPGEAGHPEACPWCGQKRIRGVTPSPDGNRQYRCAACDTTFFIHAMPQRQAEDDRLLPVAPRKERAR